MSGGANAKPSYWLLVSAAFLFASAAMHGLVGWPSVRTGLEAQGVERDLIEGAGAGWLYGTVAMVTFGVLALLAGLPGRSVRRLFWGTVTIGIAYAAFGLGVLIVLRTTHLAGFVVLGVLLCVGSARALSACPRD